jgi:NAD(P)-dependent dehydrogenase (short-subunit alcohol dehydrogenase family)
MAKTTQLSDNLNDSVTFITGGAGTLGIALACAFGRRGTKVILADRDPKRLETATEKLREGGIAASSVVLDVSDWASWEKAVKTSEDSFGPITILVNNAAVGGGEPVAAVDPRRWRNMIEVNTIGPFYGCRVLLPKMLERGLPAHILNIASLAGVLAEAGMSSYCASKHALVGMSDSLRGELASTNIGISVAYPGMMNTDFVVNSNQIVATDFGDNRTAFDPALNDLIKTGMNPERAAEHIVEGVLAGAYHIFTHGDWKPVIANHFYDRLKAIGPNADPDYHENVADFIAMIEQRGKN